MSLTGFGFSVKLPISVVIIWVLLGVNSQPTSGERIIYLRYSKGLLKYKPSLTYLDKWFNIHPCTGNWQAICVVIGSVPAPILGLVCLLSHIIFHSMIILILQSLPVITIIEYILHHYLQDQTRCQIKKTKVLYTANWRILF